MWPAFAKLQNVVNQAASAVPSFFGLTQGRDVRNRQPPLQQPERADATREKVKAAARFPAFLPYFDESQVLYETAEMRRQYRRMLADPNVKAALLGKILPVTSLEMKFHPANDKPRYQEHADFLDWNIKRRMKGGIMGLAWTVLVHACVDGYSLNEKIWAYHDGERFKGKRVLSNLKPKDVDQDAVPWVDEYKNVTGIMGLKWNAGEIWNPKEFLLYSHMPLYGNVTGISDFRSAYSRYWILDSVTKMRARGAEKRAEPVVWGEYPDGTKQISVQNILAHVKSSNWAAVPAGVKLQVMDIAGSSSDYFEKFTNSLREEIFLAIAGAILQNLTGGEGELRGSSKVHQSTAAAFKWALMNGLLQCFNDWDNGLIRDILVDAGNYRDVYDYPFATMTGIDDAELAESIVIDTGLKNLGYTDSQQGLEQRYGRRLEKAMELPAMPDGPGQGPMDLPKPKPELETDADPMAQSLQSQKTPESPDEGFEDGEEFDEDLTRAAKTLGHKGGKKGGPARAKVLSPRRRSEIASKGGRAAKHKVSHKWFSESWVGFTGPMGGKGWKNTCTGEVSYGEDPGVVSRQFQTADGQGSSVVHRPEQDVLRHPDTAQSRSGHGISRQEPNDSGGMVAVENERDGLRVSPKTKQAATGMPGTSAQVQPLLSPHEERLERGKEPILADNLRYVKTERAQREGHILVELDPQRLDSAWQKDAYYVPRGGTKDKRYDNAKKHIASGKAVYAPEASFSADGKLSFHDGRHRTAALRDSGKKSIVVSVPADQFSLIRDHLGVSELSDKFVDQTVNALTAQPRKFVEHDSKTTVAGKPSAPPQDDKDVTINEDLWQLCQGMVPQTKPPTLPWLMGTFPAGAVCKEPVGAVLVDGHQVKIDYDIDFVEGGNAWEAKFIPPGQIWIDASLIGGIPLWRHQLACLLYHESHESGLMDKGMAYEKAHDQTNAAERVLRKRAPALNPEPTSAEVAKMAETLKRNLESPTLEMAQVEIKHMLATGASASDLEDVVAKLSPGDRERLAQAHGMDTVNFIYPPGEVAEYLVRKP